MALLPKDQRGQVMLLLTMLALGGGYAFWSYYYQPTTQQIASTSHRIDSLEIVVANVKRDLARGTPEDLARTVAGYRNLLAIMRRLVPDQNEVPALIDDMSTRAKERGVTIGKIDPLAVEPGHPFDTYRYRLQILGHYDQLGEYLSDIASLPRIIVPEEVALKLASAGAQKLLGDTLGALLEADFSIRTFVKSPAPPPGAKPSPGKPGAKPGGGK